MIVGRGMDMMDTASHATRGMIWSMVAVRNLPRKGSLRRMLGVGGGIGNSSFVSSAQPGGFLPSMEFVSLSLITASIMIILATVLIAIRGMSLMGWNVCLLMWRVHLIWDASYGIGSIRYACNALRGGQCRQRRLPVFLFLTNVSSITRKANVRPATKDLS